MDGTPATLVVTFENCGPGPLNVAFASISGPDAADFGDQGPQSTPLAPGATLDVSVTYAPSAPGPSSAFLPYTPCTDCEPQAIALSGTGVDGNLVFTPSPIEFGNVPEGSTATMVVTATNLGTEPLTVTSFGVSADGNAFALSELPALPLALAPQQSATFTVSYSPSGSAGGDSGTLLANWTVADPAVGNRQANDDLSGL